MNLDHLEEETRPLVEKPVEERIKQIQSDIWVGYDRAKEFLQEIDRLVYHPRNLRMPCRALISSPDNGKSTLLKRCVNNHNRTGEGAEAPRVCVVKFETPTEPDEALLYSAILTGMDVEHRPNAPAEVLKPKVIEQCTDLDVRVLLADEFHNMLHGKITDQQQLLASLKSLLNLLGVSFVAAGIDTVVRALAADKQFVTRFQKWHLPTWALSTETRRLLKSLERRLPLAEPSGLDGKLLMPEILKAGDTIGAVSGTVKESAEEALKASSEKITLEIVQAVVKRRKDRAITA